MSSPAKSIFAIPNILPVPLNPSTSAVQDDFLAFQMRTVIRDFKLSAELFASDGDIVLICGKNTQEKQGLLLVSYEIPPSTVTASIKLLKVVRITEKAVTQMETVPIMKIALLLCDGTITIYNIDSLAKVTNVPTNNATLFSVWYDSMSRSSASDLSITVPSELRICVATKRRSLVFSRWLPQQKRVEENKDARGTFDLIDTPKALALSGDRICIGYKRSYVIMSITDGTIINELSFTLAHEPIISCVKDQTQWCIQLDATTVFLNSNFEPLYENGVTWRDVPSAVVQASPYVLALVNQSIDVCTFNGSETVPVQQISHKSPSPSGKTRLWIDARKQRIYAATTADVFILEPIPVHKQLKNYTGMYKYDSALILIRAELGMSISSSVTEHPRGNDGRAKGNMDTSTMPRVETFGENFQLLNKSDTNNSLLTSNMSIGTTEDSKLDKTALWMEYYRVGTMHAFQLFHQQQYERAFSEFAEFLTDPAEIVSLFPPLATDRWLPNSYKVMTAFVKQHQHFSEPSDFVGNKLQDALRQLQNYLTEARRMFQIIFRRAPNSYLEVQSLVYNRLLLKPVRDLLIIVETCLLKVYLIAMNNTIASALLRNQDNCCLPSEVEKELTMHNRRSDLISFYEKQNRHKEALELIINTASLSSDRNILNYLSKLDNDQLPLVLKYIKPILESALYKKDEETLNDILKVFADDSGSTSTVSMDVTDNRTVKLDPAQIEKFIKEIDPDFAIKYLESICMTTDLGTKQRDIHNRLVFSYCERIKYLSNHIQSKLQEKTISIYKDNDIMVNESIEAAASTSMDKQTFIALTSIKKRKTDYETNLKQFLVSSKCQCDFDKLEAYFLQEQNNASGSYLFSLPYAITLGKLGRHEESLEIFTSSGHFLDAEQHCAAIYSNGNHNLARDLYLQLIKYYLNQRNENSNDDSALKSILRIVNDASDRLDPVQVLEILPDRLKLGGIRDFIEQSLQTCSTKKHNSQIERNLLFLKLLRTHSNRIEHESHAFAVDVNSTCARTGCVQPFSGTQAVVRFPNNKLVHLHCKAKYANECEKRT